MNSPAIETSLLEDETSDLLIDQDAAGVTRAGSFDDGLSDADKLEPSPEKVLLKVASLKVSEAAALPETMNEAYDCASAIAAKAAKSKASGEMRQAFAELLKANSELLVRSTRRNER